MSYASKAASLKIQWAAFLVRVLMATVLFAVFDCRHVWVTVDMLFAVGGASAMPKIAVVVCAAILTYGSVACCLLASRSGLVMLGALVALAGLVNAWSHYATGGFLDASLIRVAMQELHFAGAFFQEQARGLAICVLLVTVLGVAVLRLRRQWPWPQADAWGASALLLAFALNLAILFSPTGRAPIFGMNVLMEAARFAWTSSVPFAPRARVAEQACTDCPELVMLVIDESITHEALAAVGSALPGARTLPSAVGLPQIYYPAYSAGNHSSASNFVLRGTAGKALFPDVAYATLRLPSLFTYAKAAGYRTVFYDAQARSARLQNQMSHYDLADIDVHMYSAPQLPYHQADTEALRRLRPILAQASRSQPVMLVLVKGGVHFPYLNALPPSARQTLPVECRAAGAGFTADDQACIKAQYEMALKHSADGFLDDLLAAAKGKDIALVYTGDHGQDLNARHRLPHGSVADTSGCEVSVPVWLAGSSFANFPQDGLRRSHFQIPATVLAIMGFGSVSSAGSSTLRQPWAESAQFLREPLGPQSGFRQPVDVCKY